MFSSICIRRQSNPRVNGPLDVGQLAEALLFYQTVHVITDNQILEQLLRECGPRVLVELIQEGFLKMSYLEKTTGIRTADSGNGRIIHLPVTALANEGEWALNRVAPDLFVKAAGGPGWGRQLARTFAELDIPTLDINDDLLSQVRQDFQEPHFVEQSVDQLLRVLAPGYRVPQDFRFRIEVDTASGHFYVDTNIDFQLANGHFDQGSGTGHTDLMAAGEKESLSTSALLLYLLNARADLFFAARDQADLATSVASAAVIELKCRDVLHATSSGRAEIEVFQRATLRNSHEIGTSLAAGFRTWREYVDVLKAARKFKVWLADQPADASLIGEYLSAIEKDTWIGSLPAKAVRFLLFSTVGLAMPLAVGLGLSAADNFLAERLLGGWRPNQFVNGPLKDFARLD